MHCELFVAPFGCLQPIPTLFYCLFALETTAETSKKSQSSCMAAAANHAPAVVPLLCVHHKFN